MSAITLFCDLCLFLFLIFTFVKTDSPDISQIFQDEGPKGNCSCGGFSTADPQVDMAPLISQMPGLVVKCDETGMLTCKNLCVALATATKAKGPEILCKRLKNADELILSACYQLCDKPWTFAGMTAEEPLCCEDSKVKQCVSALNQNSTSIENAHNTVTV